MCRLIECCFFDFFLFVLLSECTSEWSVVKIRVSELTPVSDLGSGGQD